MTQQEQFLQELLEELKKTAHDKNLLQEFLRDLLTPRELKDISLRWQIIKQLNDGIPQRQVARNLSVSVATVTRGSKELADKHGGFKKVLERINRPDSYDHL